MTCETLILHSPDGGSNELNWEAVVRRVLPHGAHLLCDHSSHPSVGRVLADSVRIRPYHFVSAQDTPDDDIH